jgi:Flp pilus assembly protein TadD
VQAGNAETPDWESAIRDFRRSVQVNPHVVERWTDLTVSIRYRAAELAHTDPRRAIKLLQEANASLEHVQASFPGHGDCDKQRKEMRAVLKIVGTTLNNRAVEAAPEGSYCDCISDLQLAHEVDPESETVSANLRQIVRQYSVRLSRDGDHDKARELIEQALQLFPGNAELLGALDSVGAGTKEIEGWR